jgi:hypothetical protein
MQPSLPLLLLLVVSLQQQHRAVRQHQQHIRIPHLRKLYAHRRLEHERLLLLAAAAVTAASGSGSTDGGSDGCGGWVVCLRQQVTQCELLQ